MRTGFQQDAVGGKCDLAPPDELTTHLGCPAGGFVALALGLCGAVHLRVLQDLSRSGRDVGLLHERVRLLHEGPGLLHESLCLHGLEGALHHELLLLQCGVLHGKSALLLRGRSGSPVPHVGPEESYTCSDPYYCGW